MLVHWQLRPQELTTISFTDFKTMFDAWLKIENRRAEIDRINCGRIAWLLGSDSGSTFGNYIEKYGLSSHGKPKPEKVDTQKLYSWAQKVTNQFNKG